jgi:HEAT repeat protein
VSENLKVLQVFIASPSDLAEERRAIKEVADNLNGEFSKSVGIQVQLLGWEDRLPGYGRPQGQINEDVDKADLFVGFLWRRWGSAPGNPQYTSGFEEEFNRAVELRERKGTPEISLFFKTVRITSQGEIDDQLKRVFEFKDKIASKRTLYAEFSNIEEWKKATYQLLHNHLLKLLKNMLEPQGAAKPQAPPKDSSQESSKGASGQEQESSNSIAQQQVYQVWSETLGAIRNGEMFRFVNNETHKKLQIARMGLVAASITNRDIEADLPAVHLVNLLFKNRKSINLTQLEWILILRANLASTEGFRPGWFWLKRTSLKIRGALPYLACHDEHFAVRNAALRYATKLKLRLLGNGRKQSSPIEQLCAHSDSGTRRAALEYLTEYGTRNELALVERLRNDTDADVRAQADATRNGILLRDDPSQYFERSILSSLWVGEEAISAIQIHSSRIDGNALRNALSHSDAKIVRFAVTELIVRNLVTTDDLGKVATREGNPEVLRAFFLKSISEGKKFPPKTIRETFAKNDTLLKGFFTPTQIDVHEVLKELFKLYNYEELRTIVVSDSEDAPAAYCALVEIHFGRFGDQVRSDLKNNFADYRERKKSKTPSSLPSQIGHFADFLSQALEPDFSVQTVAALSGLAIHGRKSDRNLITPFLDAKNERIRMEALKALRRVGVKDDADLALKIADDAAGDLEIEATSTALALDPGEAGIARNLFRSDKPNLLKLTLLSLTNFSPNEVWLHIRHRLYDENDKIRELVCAFAVNSFPGKRLAKILDDYVSKGRYFYNVVFMLDRAIYAKPPLRAIFQKEITEILDSAEEAK